MTERDVWMIVLGMFLSTLMDLGRAPFKAALDAWDRRRAARRVPYGLSDAGFRELCVRTQEATGKTDQKIADILLVSWPTFNRWKSGRNLPHPAMRMSLINGMREQIADVERSAAKRCKQERSSGSKTSTLSPEER